MQAVIYPGGDIQSVKVGQPVTVIVEALGDRSLSGSVTKVRRWRIPAAGCQRREGVQGGDRAEGCARLAAGVSCQAELVTDTIPSALYLPVHAVFRDSGKFTCIPSAGPPASAVKSPSDAPRFNTWRS